MAIGLSKIYITNYMSSFFHTLVTHQYIVWLVLAIGIHTSSVVLILQSEKKGEKHSEGKLGGGIVLLLLSILATVYAYIKYKVPFATNRPIYFRSD